MNLITSTTLIILSILSGEILGMPPAQCNPSFLDEVPPKIRKVCVALSTIYELGAAMENYIDDKGKPKPRHPDILGYHPRYATIRVDIEVSV